MRTQELLSNLSNVKIQGNNWTARCPSHQDKNNSLSISSGDDGKTILHCFAGCSCEEIVKAMGIKMSDLFDVSLLEKGGRGIDKLIAAYNYTDENGKLLYQVCRYQPKSFKHRRPDGNGNWIYNLSGVSKTLYKLPQLIEAVKENKTIYICEGEKDVDTLIEHGLPATTLGSSNAKWNLDYEKYFANANVVILPDNDTPGRQYAVMIANNLSGIAKSVKVVELKPLEDKQDVSDWLANVGFVDLLIDIANSTNEWISPKLPSEEIKRSFTGEEILNLPIMEMQYLQMGGIPIIVKGFAHILSAAPKSGKTELTLQSCLLWKDKQIMYISEESPELWKLRLSNKQISAEDISHIKFYFPGIQNIAQVLEEINKSDCNLIIVDTLRSIVRPGNENDNSQITNDLLPLINLSHQKKITLLVLHHTKKADDDNSVSRSAGGYAIVGLFDKVLSLSGTSEKLKLTSTGRLEQDLEAYLHWTENGIEGFDYDRDKVFKDILSEHFAKDTTPLRKKDIYPMLGVEKSNGNNLINRLAACGFLEKIAVSNGYTYRVHSFQEIPNVTNGNLETLQFTDSTIPHTIYSVESGNLNSLEDYDFYSIEDEYIPTASF